MTGPVRAGRPNAYVGSAVERVEDLRFLRGQGCFLDDMSRDGAWHAAVLRSPVAHGRIVRLDPAAALAVPGVHGVITAADIPGAMPTIPFRRPNPTIAPYAQPVIADGTVRYVGEPVALVVAETAETAEDALAAIALEVDALPAVVDWRSSAAGDTLLFAGTGGNVAAVFTARRGDTEAAFRDAPYVRRERLSVQRQTAMPMETRGLLAEWSGGRMTVFGAAKLPFFNRRALAAMLGLEDAAVDCVEVDVGGGFGARGEFYPEDFLVPFAARRFGRPVKWVEDRREHFMAIAHAREMEADLEIACSRDGRILGLRGEIAVDIGAYVRPNGMTPVRNVAQFLAGPYRVGNLSFTARAVTTNKTPAGTYRGPGRYEGSFFCERLIDIAARDLGIDRTAMRRRHLLTAADMPYPLVPVVPNDGFGDTACDSGDYRVTFDNCLEAFRWDEKEKLAGRQVDGLYHGIAVGCFIEGGGSGPRENARAAVDADGTVAIAVGSSAVGQGIETIMAQIAADALEIPIEEVRIRHGSTNLLKEGFGSYGSRATVMGGSAVAAACRALLERFRGAAAAVLGVEAAGVAVRGGTATVPDGRSVPLSAFAGLEADGSFAGSKQTYTYGAAAAHVTVDAGTGRVAVLDYLVVDDVGRIVNPLTLHGQVTGAAVQGLGAVFGEEVRYDAEGQLLVGSLADYLIPVATDFPHVRAISMEAWPSPNNPLGAKGAGEGGIIPVAGVIANAVASALSSLGVEPRHLPLTPPRLWALIAARRGPSTVGARAL